MEERLDQPRGRFYRITETLFNGMLGFYAWSFRWVLKHSFLMLLVTVATICVTIWLYNIVPKGFFPQQDTGSIMGITEGAQDISFDAMVEKQNQVTAIVNRDPAVASITSVIGSGGGGSANQGRALLALLICQVELSIVSIIGIILLIGIVEKNAIMMVDFALESERNQGLSPAESI